LSEQPVGPLLQQRRGYVVAVALLLFVAVFVSGLATGAVGAVAIIYVIPVFLIAVLSGVLPGLGSGGIALALTLLASAAADVPLSALSYAVLGPLFFLAGGPAGLFRGKSLGWLAFGRFWSYVSVFMLLLVNSIGGLFSTADYSITPSMPTPMALIDRTRLGLQSSAARLNEADQKAHGTQYLRAELNNVLKHLEMARQWLQTRQGAEESLGNMQAEPLANLLTEDPSGDLQTVDHWLSVQSAEQALRDLQSAELSLRALQVEGALQSLQEESLRSLQSAERSFRGLQVEISPRSLLDVLDVTNETIGKMLEYKKRLEDQRKGLPPGISPAN
jgi:hypothetical protein